MSKSLPTILLGGVLLVVLVVYMVFFQVRFTETAVVTTFGEPSTPYTEPNWYMKWPWPIQKVVKYDKRIHIFEDTEEQMLTNDSKSLIVVTFSGWKVGDPREFLRTVGTEAAAEQTLRDVIRSTKNGVVGGYDLANFVSTDPKEMKLREIEKKILDPVKEAAKKYGMAVETLGIKRLSLPRSVTESVFERMRKTWEKIAGEYEEQGKAIAAQIVANAEQMANRIKSFAETRARAIETEGQAKAAAMFQKFNEDSTLAELLLKLDFLKRTFQDQTVIYLDPSIEPSLELLSRVPGDTHGGITGSPAPSQGKATNQEKGAEALRTPTSRAVIPTAP
jgi:modulator of FtsH protease HflC